LLVQLYIQAVVAQRVNPQAISSESVGKVNKSFQAGTLALLVTLVKPSTMDMKMIYFSVSNILWQR
jgi:hypothetical protein